MGGRPQTWQADETAAVLHYVTDYHLGRYFQVWWTASRERQQAVAYMVQRLYAAAQHQGALTRLKLHANQLTVWRSIAPLPTTEDPIDFPGLAPYRT